MRLLGDHFAIICEVAPPLADGPKVRLSAKTPGDEVGSPGRSATVRRCGLTPTNSGTDSSIRAFQERLVRPGCGDARRQVSEDLPSAAPWLRLVAFLAAPPQESDHPREFAPALPGARAGSDGPQGRTRAHKGAQGRTRAWDGSLSVSASGAVCSCCGCRVGVSAGGSALHPQGCPSTARNLRPIAFLANVGSRVRARA